jgi:AcrR family transcriptional regulator/DNA-binding MarR family transcriptional regulator
MSVRPKESLNGKAPANRHEASHNGLERERVTDIQRTRILTALAEVAAERGATNLTVAHVVERAGVSRRTFYEIFEDIEGCLLVAIDDALLRAAQRVLPAYRSSVRWRERLRAALTELLKFIDDEPYAARLLIVETLAIGRGAIERRSRIVAQAVTAVQAGSREAKGRSAATTRLTAEGVVGAVLSVIHARMLEDRREPLLELVNPLMSMVVLPYLGPSAGRRELERRVESSGSSAATTGRSNPLKQLQMRLTYRTLRVLAAVASHPGSSNRAIGDAADISDQGQISKLLARLQRLGLIENTGAGSSSRGEPNAWSLTSRGREVHDALRAQSTTASPAAGRHPGRESQGSSPADHGFRSLA